MIDEKVLIERLERNVLKYKANDWAIGINVVKEIVAQLAEESAKDTNVLTNNGWIPCSEMLPEDGQKILFTNECGIVEAGQYEAKRNWCVNNAYFPNVFYFTYWQPLPAPYKQKEGKHNE